MGNKASTASCMNVNDQMSATVVCVNEKELSTRFTGTLAEFDALPSDERKSTFDGMIQQLQGSEGGTWEEFRDIDMCGLGDVKIVHDWKSHTTIEELKKTAEKNNYSAITVSAGEPSFGHAALKDFEYPLRPEHCKPISTSSKHPCKIYIYTPPSAFAKTGTAPVPAVPLKADPEAKRLVLVKAGSSEQCVLKHADKLTEEFVPLTLNSGEAIVDKEPVELTFAHFHLLVPGIGNSDVAMRVRLDQDGFLTREDNGYVLDIDKWRFEEGNKVWFLKEHDDASKRATRNPDGGRSFKLNPNGTISPCKVPELVLGAFTPQMSLASVAYKAEDVPLNFPLPTMGEKFILASPFDNQDKVMEIFCHQVNCPLVFSHCCSAQCAHWYVSAIDAADGAFKLSISTKHGELNVRLHVVGDGEFLSAVKQEGTWFVAENPDTNVKNRIRLRSRANDSLSVSSSEKKAEWGGFSCQMSAAVGEASLLYIKPVASEE